MRPPDNDHLPEREIEATLGAIRFRASDSAYVVGAFTATPTGESFIATGEIVAPSIGDAYALRGSWYNHPTYGKQFRFTSCTVIFPTTREGIERYLASGLIRGIGKVLARRIVAVFGETTIDVLNGSIERLREVPGIGGKTFERIRASWEAQRGMHDVLLFLRSHNLGTAHAMRIFRAYGAESTTVLRDNPYRLAEEIPGIGFGTADQIAMKLGFPPEDERRLVAGIRAILLEAAHGAGHTYVEWEELVPGSAARLGVDETAMGMALRRACEAGRVVMEGDRVFLPLFLLAELSIAESLHRIAAGELPKSDPRVLFSIFEDIAQERGIDFTPLQMDAMQRAVTQPVSIISGGPGTGKSTALVGILAAARAANWQAALCAPTGRAARRMTELTGTDAKTIHRLLEYDPRSDLFARCEEFPLDADLVVVDEVSMVDTLLFSSLLAAVPAGGRIVFIGDHDQLPPVGAGNVLHDMLACGQIPVTVLTTVFRQGRESMIVTNAHRVRSGEPLIFRTDCFFIDAPDIEEIPRLIEEVVLRRLPEEMDLDPFRDIQVLTPMHRTSAGVSHLNFILQRSLNPHGHIFLRRGERALRLGDKVMQTRNNYEKEVFNGDIGFIDSADELEARCAVRFDHRLVTYSFDEIEEEVVLAYAVTIHKSQGSEYPAVVMPMTMHHRIMLQRNLVYTGMTRAKRLLVFIGEQRALRAAIGNTRIARRNTVLTERLRGILR